MEPSISLKLYCVLIEGAIVVENINEFKVVALSDLVVVEVVGWGDLDGARTECRIDEDIVDDDRDASATEWLDNIFVVQILQEWKDGLPVSANLMVWVEQQIVG
ncbi:hypothetical protein BC936DRAFT_149942 [Jimgerdemannia flammicorona]|uniref:Uncharacterized protein n=2 Tax=Jimgerdemannia flammicorona TaxID=994334 RepID=A0A433CZT6_9FUNG|nr:hypothetical protein BC936DRAFT_149942 [Jimgerdemannia flammicorona]RUS32431.1 hypothetical protein BC938DRAFT_475397 [Jimgerdemannia flammicorona]